VKELWTKVVANTSVKRAHSQKLKPECRQDSNPNDRNQGWILDVRVHQLSMCVESETRPSKSIVLYIVGKYTSACRFSSRSTYHGVSVFSYLWVDS